MVDRAIKTIGNILPIISKTKDNCLTITLCTCRGRSLTFRAREMSGFGPQETNTAIYYWDQTRGAVGSPLLFQRFNRCGPKRLLKNSLRGFLTSRREIARRETATFLPVFQRKSSKKAAKNAILAQNRRHPDRRFCRDVKKDGLF